METRLTTERAAFLKHLFTLILCIAVLHLVATAFYFYWIYWWYDLILHFMGGFWSGSATLWLLYYSGYLTRGEWTDKKGCIQVFIGVLIVGVFWEVFEVVVGVNFHPEGFWADTIIDLIMDVAGGLTAYLYFFKKPYSKAVIARN